jgi:hypothetical protein
MSEKRTRPAPGTPRLVPVAIAAIAFFAAAVSAHAQETSTVSVFYIPTVAVQTDEETTRFTRIIDEAIRRELTLMGLELVDAPVDSANLAAARAQGTRLFFESSALVSGRELVMSFRAVDVPSERTVDAAFVPTIVGVTVLNRIDEAVGEFADSLAEFLANPGQAASIAPFALSVTVNAEPDGMEISLPSGEIVGTVENGTLAFPFDPYPVGARLQLTKRLDGYHDDEESVQLAAPVNTFVLRPLWKETRWAVDLHSTLGQMAGAGVGARYFLEPDTWFVAAENYLFYQLPLVATDRAIGHYDLGFWTGRYLLLDYRSTFRVGAGAGLGLMLTRIPESDPKTFTDFYLNIATLWAEFNTRHWFVYGQIAAKLALGLGNNLLGGDIIGVTIGDADGFPGITIGVGRKL